MTMTISQALKEKNRIAGKLKNLAARLSSCNRYEKDTSPSYIFDEVFAQYLQTRSELVHLKSKISTASQPIFPSILLLGELKASVAVLKSMPVSDNTDSWSRRTAKTDIKYMYQKKEVDRDDLVENWERAIIQLQDEIDVFNGTKQI